MAGINRKGLIIRCNCVFILAKAILAITKQVYASEYRGFAVIACFR